MPDPKHFFESVKYVPVQRIIIPYEDDFILAAAYGRHRTYNGLFKPQEVLPFLTEEFLHQKKRAESEAAFNEAHARQRSAPAIDLNLDLSNIKLNL